MVKIYKGDYMTNGEIKSFVTMPCDADFVQYRIDHCVGARKYFRSQDDKQPLLLF